MTHEDIEQLLEGKLVMVIDDEPDSLEIAETLLEELDCDIVTAVNGRDAWDQLQRITPDYIISDLSMPHMSGWDLIEAIKQERRLMEIPVFALTAHAMPGDRTRAIMAGFHNYLTKPLNPDTFISDFLQLVTEANS